MSGVRSAGLGSVLRVDVLVTALWGTLPEGLALVLRS